MRTNKHFILWLIVCFSPFVSYSQVKVIMNNVKATYALGEKAAFRIVSNVAGAGTYSIFYDPRDPTSVIQKGNFFIKQGQTDTVVIFGLPHPGLVFFKAEQNGQSAVVTAVFDPLSIMPLEAEPDDFDTFWQREKNKLKSVPINPQLTLKTTLPNGSKLYFLRLDNVDNRTVNGYIAVPAGRRKFPAVIQFPPYGTRPTEPDAFIMTDFAEKCQSIVVLLTVHNVPPNQEDPNAYKPEDVTDPLKYYNRWMLLGGIRAIDYIFSRPDFNGSLGLNGNSQGAGLAISIAGLDDRVKAVLAIAPAHCEQQGTRYNRASGFPRYNIGVAAMGLDTNKVKKASKYHEGAYFLKRYKGALMIQTGYRDDVTPSATHFAAYNQFKGTGVMLHLRDMGHNYPNEYWFGRYAFYNQHLVGFENPFQFKKTYHIEAGEDIKKQSSDSVVLKGEVFKDGIIDEKLPVLWQKLSGSGTVTFDNPTSRVTKVRFSEAGTYVLRFSAEDNYLINDHTEAKFYSMRDFITIEVLKKDDNSSKGDLESRGLQVSPNPSNGIFNARWHGIYSYKRVFVLGSYGRTFFEQTLNPEQKTIQLDLSKIPDGNYTIVFVNIYGRWIAKKITKISS